MTGAEVQQTPQAPDRLGELEIAVSRPALPPVDTWDPPFCGDLDMRIAADGSWHYRGSVIGRRRMVRLFSTILRREPDGSYVLVTPVEKFTIAVDDAPFTAVRLEVRGSGKDQVLTFETNVDDRVTVDAEHPLRFERQPSTDGLKPYVLVRGRLEALVTRALAHDLVELGCEEAVDDAAWFGVWSGGRFWPMAPAAAMAP